ncbi:MAG: type II/IV secretion system ATPase subunit [Chloroflexi bacterium]|nr:type II/IV secretion system ATPase subunit [Chloroflexota bacterium]
MSDNSPTPGKNGHRKDIDVSTQMSPIIPGRSGRPSFSLEALRERVEQQFQEETANRPDILLDLDDEEKRRDLLREVVDYVLAVESISLSERDKWVLVDMAYNGLFMFGPLDRYLRDERVTEITVKGPTKIHVRYGLGSMQLVDAAFEDRIHLEEMLTRVLATGQAVLSETEPFLEVGVTLAGRPARLSLISPPISPDFNLSLRLHPRVPLTLDDLYHRFNAMQPQAAALLTAILQAGHGLLIVGEVALGKTTAAGALATALPTDVPIIAAERAAELTLPAHITRLSAIPPTPGKPGVDFTDQIRAALDQRPAWLIIDEIRGDESAAVWEALTRNNVPRYLWVFRGDPAPDRLRSALGMVLRKQRPGIDQQVIDQAILRHLPFVAAFRRISGLPRLVQIAEWVPGASADQPPILHPLQIEQDGVWQNTDHRPMRL